MGWRPCAWGAGWASPPLSSGCETMSVLVETSERVTTITIDRPQAKNAVDGPTAHALFDAFKAFDADPRADVAILTGAGGTFCAGADLKAVSGGIGDNPQSNPLNTDI